MNYLVPEEPCTDSKAHPKHIWYHRGQYVGCKGIPVSPEPMPAEPSETESDPWEPGGKSPHPIENGSDFDLRYLLRQLALPPQGWFTFGTHASASGGKLEFWGKGLDGTPIWERPTSPAPAPTPQPGYTSSVPEQAGQLWLKREELVSTARALMREAELIRQEYGRMVERFRVEGVD